MAFIFQEVFGEICAISFNDDDKLDTFISELSIKFVKTMRSARLGNRLIDFREEIIWAYCKIKKHLLEIADKARSSN